MARTRAVMLVRAGGGSWGLGYILHMRLSLIMLALTILATILRWYCTRHVVACIQQSSACAMILASLQQCSSLSLHDGPLHACTVELRDRREVSS